jgi:NAD(P)-dependent dehydrogenase (short-subunit alcohol dehydrogenase family)
MTTSVVTGSAGGIGSATVSAFEAAGHTVHGIDLDDDPVAIFGRLDRLDALVCAHGISGRRLGDGPVDTCPEEAWDAVLDANLRSVFLYCKHPFRCCARPVGAQSSPFPPSWASSAATRTSQLTPMRPRRRE